MSPGWVQHATHQCCLDSTCYIFFCSFRGLLITLGHYYRRLSFYVMHHPEKTLTVASCLCQATLWTMVIYFMTGLSIKDGSWHFWVFYVIMTLTALNGASLVRFLAYFSPDRDAANALIGIYRFTWLFLISASKCINTDESFSFCIHICLTYNLAI